ncbi:RED-like protein N-terminal region-domain-containing protein [Multifurca ochricompacta]|uniref:RED-like protein N-terminal region-domain-containing protein n=1 Tax=Multifurca ochricompacta TaxID=376703 RepID=A0AAD4M9C4_9AGAM|nr:RED-like protein N-terminal region-domain-containing protein [Multifurca ochricompacta]
MSNMSMNQDAFRSLLQSEKPIANSTTASRGSLIDARTKKVVSSSEPVFKPRKVKKASEAYRDRAEERRLGKEGDYAQVEAILEEFEKRNADNEDRAAVDAQRRYLGGDSDHSILVKGLDFALLEQNKARLASTSSKRDDEALEEAFVQTASTSSPPLKKRTRAEIINQLKEKRANGSQSGQLIEDAVTEKRPDPSKFRLIGFKPIGASTEKAKKRVKEGGETKKKKRKVEPSATVQAGPKDTVTRPHHAPAEQVASTNKSTLEPELVEGDFDIFADAGEYKGVDLGSDDDDDGLQAEHVPASGRRGWFEEVAEPNLEASPSPVPAKQAKFIQEGEGKAEAEAEAEEERPTRLESMSSSTMPSIRDFLAMDEAVEKEEKRKARKEKRKGKNKVD